MNHWTEHYIGAPYVEGKNDCASFTARVQREWFGREIPLPVDREANYLGWSRQIESHREDYAAPTETPEEGDAVLMIGRGRLNHLGTYCLIGGEQYVLHAMKSAGQVVLHRVRDLPMYGLTVEGFYRWR